MRGSVQSTAPSDQHRQSHHLSERRGFEDKLRGILSQYNIRLYGIERVPVGMNSFKQPQYRYIVWSHQTLAGLITPWSFHNELHILAAAYTPLVSGLFWEPICSHETLYRLCASSHACNSLLTSAVTNIISKHRQT